MATENSYTNPNLTITGNRLSEAQQHFTCDGYTNTPTPWVVSKDAYYSTKPKGSIDWPTPTGGYMVASGEQGFIQLLMQGVDLDGRMQTTTPCYRVEDAYDELHHSYFYKLELCIVSDSRSELDLMIRSAKRFFDSVCEQETSVIKTDIGYDIVSASGVELGSYGFRSIAGLPTFIYGTGYAEPRWSACNV